MTKRISFKTQPRNKNNQEKFDPDRWVNNKRPQKRFTIDIPLELHTRIKTICASKGVKMREEVIVALEKHFSVKN